MATTRIKVRFNLSAGKNYMKWKVEYPDRKPEYYDPNEVQLLLGGCTLKNHRKTAQKIYEGANKTVCAWVLCDHIQIFLAGTLKVGDKPQFKYNPRVRPNWMWGEEVIDGCHYHTIMSHSNKLYYHESYNSSHPDYEKEPEILRMIWSSSNPIVRKEIYVQAVASSDRK